MPWQKKQFIRLQEYNNKRRKLGQKTQEKGILGEERIFEEKTIEFYGGERENETTDGGDETNEEEKTDRTDETDEEENKKANEEEEKIQACLLTTTLVWKNAERENTRTIKGIPKTIYYHKFGTSGSLAKAAKGTHKITNFFASGSLAFSATSTHTSSTSTFSALSVADKDDAEAILYKRIAQLWNKLLENGQIFTAFEYNRRRAVYEYLIRLNDNGKMK